MDVEIWECPKCRWMYTYESYPCYKCEENDEDIKVVPKTHTYMTPDQFDLALRDIVARYGDDIENAHRFSDWLIKEQLKLMGYAAAIETYESFGKWYA